MTPNPPDKRYPWRLFFTSFLLLECAVWFWMSITDYRGSIGFWTMRTGIMFVVGQVFFILPGSIAYSMIWCVVARRFGRQFGWAASLIISSVLIALSVYSALPSIRIRALIGEEAWREAHAEVFHQWEAHTIRGYLREGVITGPPVLIETIAKHCGLKKVRCHIGEVIAALPRDLLPHDLPEEVVVYRSGRCVFYRDPEDGEIYFHEL